MQNVLRRLRSLGTLGLALVFVVGLAAPSLAAPKHLAAPSLAAPKHLAAPALYTSGWSAYRACDIAGANDYKIRVYFRASVVGYQPDDINVAWNQTARPGTTFDNVSTHWRNVSGSVTYQSWGYDFDTPFYGPTTFDAEPSAYTTLPTYSYRLELWNGSNRLCWVTITRAA